MDCHQMKSVISLWILLCVLRMRPRKVAASFSSCGVRKCLYSSLTVIALTLACEANVSVWFRSKEQPRNDV